MGLLDCFPKRSKPGLGVSVPPSGTPALQWEKTIADDVGARRAALNEADAVAVLQITTDNRDSAVCALKFCPPVAHSSRQSAEVPRVTCRLSSPESPAKHGWDLPLPDSFRNRHGLPGAWLHAEPVAANDSACAAWGMQDLPTLAHALTALVLGSPALLAAMSEVAMHLAAPWDALQSVRMTQPHARLCKAPGGGNIRIHSSYIRDPSNGTLSPALVLEMQGVMLLPQALPSPSGAAAVSRPLPSPSANAAAVSVGRAASQVHSQTGLASTSGKLSELRTGRDNRRGAATARASLQDDVLANLLTDSVVRARKRRKRERNGLLRAEAMLAALPCVATLLDLGQRDLNSEGVASLEPSAADEPAAGRVLMQNTQSLEYWGKLTKTKKSGVQKMLTLLFPDNPGVMLELQQLQAQPGHLDSAGSQPDSWKRVVNVPYSCRRRRRHQQSSQQAGQSVSQAVTTLSGSQVPSSLGATGGQGQMMVDVRQNPFKNAAPEFLEQQRRSPTMLEGSPSQGISYATTSWQSSTSRQSTTLFDRRRTTPSGTSIADASPGYGVSSRASAPPEGIMGTSSLDESYAVAGTQGEDAEAEQCTGSTNTGSVSTLYHRASQPVLPLDRNSSYYKRFSGSATARGTSSNSLCFPHLPEMNPPSVSTRVMKLSLLTAAGSSQGSASSIDLRQRSHIELHHQTMSPMSVMGASRRIASMSSAQQSAQGQGLRSGMSKQSSRSKGLGNTGVRSPVVVPVGRGANACQPPSSRLGNGILLHHHSWQRSGMETGTDDQSTSHLTSPSTRGSDRGKGGPFLEPSTSGGGGYPAPVSIIQMSDLASQDPSQRHHASASVAEAVGRMQPSQRRRQTVEHRRDRKRHEHSDGDGHVSGEDYFSLALADLNCERAGARSSSGGSSSSGGGSVSDLSEAASSYSDLCVGEEDEQGQQPAEMLTHEVQAIRVVDPVTRRPALLLLQTDITARALMEKRMSALTETQLTMLENMLPRQVLEYAIGGAGPISSLAYQHEEVTVLFMDVVGFTNMSKNVEPHVVMGFLNSLFSKLDEMCEMYDCYKVDTAGDCYIAAGALMTVDEDGFIALNENADPRQGARNVVAFAQELMYHVQTVFMPHDGRPTSVRVGVHTGSVVSGLVGTKMFKYSLFGDTMNTSSRMESTSRPGCIQITSDTYEMLEDDQRSLFKPTGGVEVKGKGLMATYIYTPSLDKSGHATGGPLVVIAEESSHEQDRTSTHSDATSRLTSRTHTLLLATTSASAPTSTMLPEVSESAWREGDGEMTPSGSRDRRRSMEVSRALSQGSPVAAGSSTTPNTTPTGKGVTQGRRSSFACYGTTGGPGRRSEHVVADMFRAAAAVVEQQQQQQQQQQQSSSRDGILSKLGLLHVKPMPKQ